MAYLYLICAFVLNASANILFKAASEKGWSFSGGIVSLVSTNWQFLLGLFLFAANVIFYFLALRALPLSIAYPIMISMTLLIVNGYALVVFHETITPLQFLGFALIVVGLSLVVAKTA